MNEKLLHFPFLKYSKRITYKAVEENFFFLFYWWTEPLESILSQHKKVHMPKIQWAGLRLTLFLDHFFLPPQHFIAPF
jgi:hypothetical protein